MKALNVLIIEDHPQIIESFKMALSKISKDKNEYNFTITEAINIDRAYDLISKNSGIFYNLIFLDISLPKSKYTDFLSGEDLGLAIRKITPESKIIVATTYTDNFRLINILKSLEPNGFLVKNDLVPKALIAAIETVLDGSPAYSKTVNKLIKKIIANDIILDVHDRRIIYELSIGTKMSNLPEIIPLSMSAIEGRKRKIKLAFGISNGDDKTLVEIAKGKGFI